MDAAMKGWMRPHELDRQRDRDRFDPIAEGCRYGLSREVSLAIWERACAEAIDRNGQHDPEQAQRQFHEMAARVAARGGRLAPDVGRLTRVGVEQGGHPFDVARVAGVPGRTNRVPGRQTRVAAEARRWARAEPIDSGPPRSKERNDPTARVSLAGERPAEDPAQTHDDARPTLDADAHRAALAALARRAASVSLFAPAAAKQGEDTRMNAELSKLVDDGPTGDVDKLPATTTTDPDKPIADQAIAIAEATGDMRAPHQAAAEALAGARAEATDPMDPARTDPARTEDGPLDLLTLWLGAPRAGILRDAEASDREAIRALLDREQLVVEPEQVEVLARLFGRNLPATLWLAGGARDGLARLIEHAGHHCGPSCGHPSKATAHREADNAEVLDDVTRAAIAHTIGFDVGPVPVVRDRDLTGRGGLAAGGVIRLEPDLANDDHGRKVRLHEAVHIAQTRVPGPVADRELVEAEAAQVAHAAQRGERQAPQLRADPGGAYGFDLGDILPDLPDMSPTDLLRKFAPDVANFIDQGFDGFLEQLGAGANKLFQKVLDGLGVDKFTNGFKSLTAAVGPGSMVFGVLTGCCECLDSALDKLGGKLDQFLASDAAKKVQNAIGDAQEAHKDQVLDSGAGFFAFLKKVGGPVLGAIDKVASAIEWVKKKVGPLASKVWGFICKALGLDASLPPLEAIKKKLGELWEKASAALAPLRNAISSAVDWLKNASPLAPLFKLADDVKKLVAGVKKLIATKAKDAKAWLASLAKDLAGTVFEPLLSALLAGQAMALGAAGAVAAWFANVLGKLGALEAWGSSIAFLQAIVETVQRFVGKVKAALLAVSKDVEKLLRDIADACQKFYKAIKPLFDFVCGFAVAIAATMMGNLMALPLFFAGNLWLHALPECYKEPIVDFCLKSFIKVVNWVPAKGMPIFKLVKSAVLAFLNRLLATPRDQKIKAMDKVASLFAGNAQFTLGLVVGIFKGIYDSTIGTVVFIFETAAWLAEMGMKVVAFAASSVGDILRAGGLVEFMREAGEDTAGVEDVERDLANGTSAGPSDETAGQTDDEDVEEDAPVELGQDDLADDTPDEDSDPTNSGDEPAVLEGGEEPAAADAAPGQSQAAPGKSHAEDDGRFDPLPPLPGDLRNGRALFDAIFKQGVTRQDLEELLNTVGTGLEPMAAKAGGDAAKAMIDALLKDSAAYQIGETVGRIIGVVAVEVTLAALTGGGSLAKTALTLTKFTVKLAKSLPRLMKMVNWVLDALRPLLDAIKKLKKGIGAWAARVAKYIEELIAWGKKNIQKLVNAIKARARGDRPSPRGPRPDKRDGKPDKDGHDRDNPDGKPRDKTKRDQNLRVAAERAAREGWNRMDSLAGAVHELSAARGNLRGATVRRARGIRVEVSLVSMGSGWKVQAVASKGARRATARSGEGWITRADKNRSKWYAIESERRLHKTILDDAIASLHRSARAFDPERNKSFDEYIAERIDSERAAAQSRITLDGVAFQTQEGERRSTADFDELTFRLVVTPNAQSDEVRLRDASGKVWDSSPGRNGTQWRLRRKNVSGAEKIEGEPEATKRADANREALAAELAASRLNVERVFLGRAADQFLTGSAGRLESADVVAVTESLKFYIYEAKGTEVTHAVDQLDSAVWSVSSENVAGLFLVTKEFINAPNYTVDGAGWLCYWDPDDHAAGYQRVSIQGHGIKVIFSGGYGR